MLRRTLKLAWFKRSRYALTIVAIGLSVAFIVSTLLLTSSIADVGAPLNEAYGEVDVVVTGPPVSEGDGPIAAVTAPVTTDVVDAIEELGYEVVGFSSPYAQVIGSDGSAAGQAQAEANIAEPWLGGSSLNGFTIVDGTAPSNLGEMAMDVTTANAASLSVGDAVTYVTETGPQQADLVGIASFGGGDNDPYISTILLPETDPVFDVERGFDYVLVDSAASAADPIAAVSALPAIDGLIVESGPEWVLGEVELLNSFLGFFETFLTVFAVIAVVVGMLIVTNTFTVSLAQRTQELALFRLVGTTRRQLMSQVVIEAVLLGLAGTVIGVIVGLLGVNAMGAFLDVLGLTIERSSTIAPSAIIVGAVVGIGVTVFASVMPARKATAVAPIEALRTSEVEPPSAGRRRTVVVAIFAILGLAGLVYGALEGDIVFAGVGIAMLFLTLYFGGEYLVRGSARLARPALKLAGPPGELASRNLERNAGRTAAASSALMIGVSLISFFTLMAATIGTFIAGDAAESLTSDYVVQGIGNPPGAVLNDDLLTSLSSVEGVETVAPSYLTSVTPEAEVEVSRPGPGDGVLGVAISDIDMLLRVFDFEFLEGAAASISGSSVVVDEATADSYGLSVGDSFEVASLAGSVELNVGAVVALTMPGQPQPAIVGNLDLAEVVGYDQPATLAYVNASADQSSINESIGLATVAALTTDDYVASLGSNLDTILALVYALLAVAVIIALVGIANTVSLAIAERVGEIAAVRAAGASMRQVFWSLISEFGLLALVGVVTGLLFAWVAAAGFFQALSSGQISYPETNILSGVVIVVIGLLGGAFAAWLPARSASRSDLLDVLRAE